MNAHQQGGAVRAASYEASHVRKDGDQVAKPRIQAQ